MLEKIQLLNPDYQIQELNENFKDYGRVIKQDEQEAINFAQTYQNINAYDTSIKELDTMYSRINERYLWVFRCYGRRCNWKK